MTRTNHPLPRQTRDKLLTFEVLLSRGTGELVQERPEIKGSRVEPP